MTETLRNKQSRFAKSIAELILWIYANGYEITFAECYRTPEQAALNQAKGSGIANSLHTMRLAIDINLFRDGVWLTSTEDFRPIGIKWETMAEDHRWGGRFKDGNHFSITHEGIS